MGDQYERLVDEVRGTDMSAKDKYGIIASILHAQALDRFAESAEKIANEFEQFVAEYGAK